MKLETTASETLLRSMNRPEEGCNIVTAGFENEVPPQYKVTIIQIGATVNYDDSSSEVLGPKNVAIGYGGVELLMSQCTDKCCVQIFGALVVKQQGKPPVTLTDTRNATPGHCLLNARFVLEIKQEATRDELSALAGSGNIVPLPALRLR